MTLIVKSISVFIIPVNVSEIIERMHTNKSHLLANQNTDNPLDGRVLTVKVPFRYRRVMCEVKGRPIQSLLKGDEVEVVVDFKGVGMLAIIRASLGRSRVPR